MASKLLEFSIVGQEAVQGLLRGLKDALDVEAILDESAAIMLNRIRTRFLAQESPDGIPWVPSQAALIRAKRGIGGGTLYRSGRLFHSIQLFGRDDVSRTIGTDVPYGVYHNNGEGQERREFMGFSNEDLTVATALVIKRVEDALK